MIPGNFLDRYITLVLRYRWWAIALSTLIMLALASGGKHITISNEYRDLFGENDPQLIAYEALEDTYTETNTVLIAVAPEEGSIFTVEALSAIGELTERAWQTPYSIRVDSLANYYHTWSEDDDLIVEALVGDATTLTDEDLARIEGIALSEREVVGNFVSTDGETAGIFINFSLPDNPDQAVVEITDFLDTLFNQQRELHPGIQYYASGFAYFNRALADSAKEDLATLFPIAVVVILALLAVLLRSAWGTFAILMVILFSVSGTMGFVGWGGFVISPPNAGLPLIVLTIATADAVHVISNALAGMRKGVDKATAIAESILLNAKPILLTSITTAIGFLSLNASETPPFRVLGNTVAFGVLLALFYSVFLLPALLSVLPLRAGKFKKPKWLEYDVFGYFADLVIARRKSILVLFALGGVVLVSGIHRIELSEKMVTFFDESTPVRQSTDFIIDNLTGLDKLEYSLDSGSDDGIVDPEYLRKVDSFAAWLRSQPEVTHVQAISDLLKRINRNLHGDDAAYYRLPEDRELTAQFLLLYELSLPLGRDLNDRMTIGKSSTRLTATIRDVSSRELREINSRAEIWLQENIPEFAQEATGQNVIIAYMTQRNIVSMLNGTIIAMVLISVLLVWLFKSLRIGALSLVPNFIPAFLAFGVWGYLVGEVGIAASVIVAFAFGIVVDDTVHFLSKYLKVRREGQSPPDAIRYTFRTVGNALWTTTAVLSAGFLVFTVSGYEPSWVLGILVTVTILFAIVADFLLFPVLLLAFDRKDRI